MTTAQYAMVRGSAIRVTELGRAGELSDPIRFAVSRSVARVAINEVSESGGHELIRSDDGDPRIHFVQNGKMIRHTVDIDFLRVDPGVLSLVAGAPMRTNAAGDVVGFDSDTRRPATSFGLEVWSKLDGQRCEDGTRLWGYTLLPFLRGGYLSGFKFDNGVVTFNLRGAQSRRMPRWGVGPYDLEGPYQRLTEVVSRNTLFKSFITPAVPPAQQDGVQQVSDAVDGEGAATLATDVIDGESVVTSTWIVEGGGA